MKRFSVERNGEWTGEGVEWKSGRVDLIVAGARHEATSRSTALTWVEKLLRLEVGERVAFAELEDDEAAKAVSPWEGTDQAEGELRWYFCESAGALGEHSAWASLVHMAQAGGHSGTRLEPFGAGVVTAPDPTPQQIWAAARQGRIREALRKLTEHRQAILERQFSLGRADVQIKGLLGQHDASKLEPTISYLARVGRVDVVRMVSSETYLVEVITLGRGEVEGALDEYRGARGIEAPKGASSKGRKRDRGGAGELVSAGAMGASKRKLVPVEAPRKSRP